MAGVVHDLLLTLSAAPDSQVDPSITARLFDLSKSPSRQGMKSILDDCAKFSLASDFAMVALALAMDKME